MNQLKAPEDITDQLAALPKIDLSETGGISLKDTMAYVYTSGTTGGLPKAAVITHKYAPCPRRSGSEGS